MALARLLAAGARPAAARYRTPSGNPAADLINGGRIRKQLADVSKLFHVSECALRIFLPSDGAFDDKITETFHYNAAGERGRRGVFCDEIAAVAIQGHIFYGIPAYSRAGSRTTRSRYNRFSFARQAVSFSNVRFFLRILAYKQSTTYRSCNGILNGLQRPCAPLTKIPQNGYFPNLTSFFQNQVSRYSVFLPNH